MKILLAAITGSGRSAEFDPLVARYLERLTPYAVVESLRFRSEEALFDYLAKLKGRTGAGLVLLDGRGRMFSSEELAGWLGQQRDGGQQMVAFAIGPADGWSDSARQRAGLLLSLGPMTLPHELARVVVAEQVYRAFTILAGHPYHTGHR